MRELHLFLFSFYIYAFLGWVLESFYKSVLNQKMINSGFLIGPLVPVYGFGALATLLGEYYLSDTLPLWLRLLLYTLSATLIEYYTGALLEQIFQVKLWDYSEQRFNIKGRVCLLHSFYWTGMSAFVILVSAPFFDRVISSYGKNYLPLINLLLFAYTLIDLIVSVKLLSRLVKVLRQFKESFLDTSQLKLNLHILQGKRLLYAFPRLNNFFFKNINLNIKEFIIKSRHIFNINSLPLEKLRDLMESNYSEDRDFTQIVGDILAHAEFQKLKNYRHHDSSIYEHVVKVAYLSYKISKHFSLDYRSTARGALLHDFFFYDWHKKRPIEHGRERLHAFHHPRAAYKNAMKHFTINDMEKDIIVKHMFPLTIRPPKYKETFIVLMVDKLVATGEFFSEITRTLKKPEA